MNEITMCFDVTSPNIKYDEILKKCFEIGTVHKKRQKKTDKMRKCIHLYKESRGNWILFCLQQQLVL